MKILFLFFLNFSICQYPYSYTERYEYDEPTNLQSEEPNEKKGRQLDFGSMAGGLAGGLGGLGGDKDSSVP